MGLIRNFFRRRLRSFLTIFGIAIGAFALVVMGAMAEKINLLVDGGNRYFSGKVIVSDASVSGGFSSKPISIDKVGEVKKVDGVADAFPQVLINLDANQNVIMGVPKIILSATPGADKYEDRTLKINYVAGRKLQPGDFGKCAVGADLVKDLNAKVGGKVKVRGKEFEVVGIMEKTLAAPDSEVSILLPDAQQIFFNALSKPVQKTVKKEDLASEIVVYPESGVDPEVLAKRVKKNVKEINATGPSDFKKQTGQATVIFNAIIFSAAAISLLVGGLSVINTMMMAVAERTREIGIKKAIGASEWSIVSEFLAEAATIGAVGGLIGLGAGWAFVQVANLITASSGTVVFVVTARLAVGSMLFSIALGAGAGLYPARKAARLNPVRALRYQ